MATCFAAARASLSRRSSGDDRMMATVPAISVTRLIAQTADWLANVHASRNSTRPAYRSVPASVASSRVLIVWRRYARLAAVCAWI